MISYHSRVRGCLLGGAIGDALGWPVEFLSSSEIAQRFGPSGLVDLVSGEVTDDTQLTLFTVDALIRAAGGADPGPLLWSAYLRWLATQQGARAVPDPGWLYPQAWLHVQRAPGTACLGGLSAGVPGRPDAPVNPESKGCGAVMRSAPFGLLRRIDAAAAFRLAVDGAVHTHGHPTGYLAAGALAFVVHRLLSDAPLRSAAEAVLDELARWPSSGETAAAVKAALAGGPPSSATVASLGEGWVAEEALAIGLYCALACCSPGEVRDALLLAVNHGGDSDSTGAICGNLLGALHGEDALPPDWLVRLEGRDTITLLADDLVLSAHPVHHLPAWRTRYPVG